MTTPLDLDTRLESLQEELRVNLSTLNDLHHPVYPADPRRLSEVEARIGELRESIIARRRELRAGPASA